MRVSCGRRWLDPGAHAVSDTIGRAQTPALQPVTITLLAPMSGETVRGTSVLVRLSVRGGIMTQVELVSPSHQAFTPRATARETITAAAGADASGPASC